MGFLLAAAALIIVAFILRWWIGVNLEEGFLGKGLMLIIVVLVVVGLLSLFGLLPSSFRWGGVPGSALAALPFASAGHL